MQRRAARLAVACSERRKRREEILSLRQKAAERLGFRCHAERVTSQKMARCGGVGGLGAFFGALHGSPAFSFLFVRRQAGTADAVRQFCEAGHGEARMSELQRPWPRSGHAETPAASS